MGIVLQDIFKAQRTIRSIAQHTPLVSALDLSTRFDSDIRLKLETTQETGAFKLRGAANKILNLTEEQRKRGIITVSTGNHGRAVAYVAKSLNINATVCVSELVPANKIDALQQLGVTVVIDGQSQDDAAVRAAELQKQHGYTLIHPFDDPFIIAGQGTIGLELLQDFPDIDTVIIPLSGGGLIGGVALALKSANLNIRVIGVSMERGPVMYHSLKAGYPIELAEQESLADSLGGGIGLQNQYTFSLAQQYVDEVVLLTEEEIAQGMAYAFRQLQLVTEGAGAVPIAAVLSNKVKSLGKHIALVISGANVNMTVFTDIVRKFEE